MKLKGRLLVPFSRRRGPQSGVTTIEYAIMLSMVGISVAAFGLGVGESVTSVFSRMVVALADDDEGGKGKKDKPGETCCD